MPLMEPKEDIIELLDVLDRDKASLFASLCGSGQMSFSVTRYEGAARSTGRERVRIELLRASVSERYGCESGHITTFYRPERLSGILGIRGRLVSGLQDFEDVPLRWRAYIQEDSGLSLWESTRGLQTGCPREVKQVLRHTSVVDADAAKSFPYQVLCRHPELKAVEQWVKEPDFCCSTGWLAV